MSSARASLSRPRIFVSIASYRDPECQWTIKDLFDRAEYPERIFAGVCWQADPQLDTHCFDVPASHPGQVRELSYHARDSKGGCWARAQALSLWEGEEYILQIDAHMRFVDGWDTRMIDNLRRCPSSNAVLSTMPPSYHPPRMLQDCTNGVPITYVGKLGNADELQPIWLSGYIRKKEKAGDIPLLGAFIVGNFLFGPARAFREVPFDPHIYFRGQEPVYSARLWTHGWDVYHPDEVVIYHYWDSPEPQGGAMYKKPTPQAQLAKQRVLHLLGIERAKDARALVDIERYGMGSVRSLADFWAFSGIDLMKGIIEEKASKCQWTPHLPNIQSLQGIAMTMRFPV